MAIASETSRSIVVVNHEEVRITDINELRNKDNAYIAPFLKAAQKFNYSANVIAQYPDKFEDINKPILKGYVKATDYLSEEQVVETSDIHDPKAIVYIPKSDAFKIKERGYLWCTKQVILWSYNLDHYAHTLKSSNNPESLKEYNVRELTKLGFSNINVFADQPNMLGLTKVKNGYHSGAMKIIARGRVLDLYTFSCNKENQKKITQDLTEWAELIVNAN